MATQQPAPGSRLRPTKSESVDESDESFPRSEEKPAAAKPAPAALTQTQVYLNFGLVGTSCTIAQSTVHWTQTTMVRQQLASAASGAEPSFVATLTGLYSSEGVLGLYRGFQSAAFREMTYSSLRFGLYEPIKGLLGASGPNSAPWQNVASGLLAGTIAAAVASPTDLLTARQMRPGPHLGMIQTARAVVGESGVRGLYRGIDTTVTCAPLWRRAAQRLRPLRPSSTPRQRQIKLRAASSLGQPRPVGRYVLAGRPYQPCFLHALGASRWVATSSSTTSTCRPCAQPCTSTARRKA